MSGAGSLARRASRPRERRCENMWHLAAPSHDVGTQSRGQCDSIPATLLPSMLLEVGHRADLVCICVSVCMRHAHAPVRTQAAAIDSLPADVILSAWHARGVHAPAAVRTRHSCRHAWVHAIVTMAAMLVHARACTMSARIFRASVHYHRFQCQRKAH